jgi:hypothetical protein
MTPHMLYGALIAWVFFWVGLYIGVRCATWYHKVGA